MPRLLLHTLYHCLLSGTMRNLTFQDPHFIFVSVNMSMAGSKNLVTGGAISRRGNGDGIERKVFLRLAVRRLKLLPTTLGFIFFHSTLVKLYYITCLTPTYWRSLMKRAAPSVFLSRQALAEILSWQIAVTWIYLSYLSPMSCQDDAHLTISNQERKISHQHCWFNSPSQYMHSWSKRKTFFYAFS